MPPNSSPASSALGGPSIPPPLRPQPRAQDAGVPCLRRGEGREPPSPPLGPHWPCKGRRVLALREQRELGWEVGDEGGGMRGRGALLPLVLFSVSIKRLFCKIIEGERAGGRGVGAGPWH